MRPPPGIASRALTARFISTCSSCASGAMTIGDAAAGSKTIWTSSPMTRSSSERRRVTRQLRSSRTARCGARRLNASSCPVSSAARLAAWKTSAIRSACSVARARKNWMLSRMTVRRLLKSWAMPPARRPSASIFCACTSRCSSSLPSVTSMIAPTIRCGTPCGSRKIWASPITSRIEPPGRTTRKSARSATSPAAARSESSFTRTRSSGWIDAMKLSKVASSALGSRPRIRYSSSDQATLPVRMSHAQVPTWAMRSASMSSSSRSPSTFGPQRLSGGRLIRSASLGRLWP